MSDGTPPPPPENPGGGNQPPGYGDGGYPQQPPAQQPPAGGYGAAYPPPPPGYPQGGETGFGQPKTNTLAIVALVTGILGLCCGFLGVAGIITGIISRRQINESNGQQTGAGMALAGIILGSIAVVLGIITAIMAGTGSGPYANL